MKLQQFFLSTIYSVFFAFLLIFVFDVLSVDVKKEILAKHDVFTDNLSIEEIILRVKKRYDVLGFHADFCQMVTLSHIGTTDIAYGNLSVLKPNKIRWEYTTPYSQVIIYDNSTMWIFNPEDEQVVVVDSKLFLEKSIDIAFIFDLDFIRDNFNIYLEKELQDLYQLRLMRKKASTSLSSELYVSISKRNYDLLQIKVITSYGDETIIKLDKINLESAPSPNIFKLDIPENVDILELDG